MSASKPEDDEILNQKDHSGPVCKYKLVVFDWKGTIQVSHGRRVEKDIFGVKKMKEFLGSEKNFSTERLSAFDKYYHDLSHQHQKQTEESGGSVYYSRHDTLNSTFDVFDLKDPAIRKKLHDIYFEAYNSFPIDLYPGATHLLKTLKKHHVAMGLVRNSGLEFHEFQPRLSKLNCTEFFEENNTVLSGSLGVGKPEKLPFQTLLKKMNLEHLSPHEIIMIGNETEHDVEGANRMGWDSVLITTSEQTSHGKAKFEFASLPEFHNFLFGENSD